MNKYKDVTLFLKKWLSGLFIITLIGILSFGFLFALMRLISN